jgi:hypothetical protein
MPFSYCALRGLQTNRKRDAQQAWMRELLARPHLPASPVKTSGAQG